MNGTHNHGESSGMIIDLHRMRHVLRLQLYIGVIEKVPMKICVYKKNYSAKHRANNLSSLVNPAWGPS